MTRPRGRVEEIGYGGGAGDVMRRRTTRGCVDIDLSLWSFTNVQSDGEGGHVAAS